MKGSKKISTEIFLLRKLKLIISVDVLISVYLSHFQSRLCMDCMFGRNDKNVKKLLILLKRGIRIIICRVKSRCHCKP